MPVSPARAAAFDILLRVERESAYASELLHSAAFEALSSPDHALATELVLGVLRWRSVLDDEISSASTKPLTHLDVEILIALRLGLYQMRRLDRIPRHAAVDESVELVKRARKRSAAAFVNAILRRLARGQADRAATVQGGVTETPQDLARRWAHPVWLVERWVRDYGFADTRKICEYDQSIPATAIRPRGPGVEARLAEEGITFVPGALLASARRVQGGDISRSQSVQSGDAVIQDEASQLVAAFLGQGTEILDCCAAPGGKTLGIADRNPNSAITAVEFHPHRARQLRQFLRARTGSGLAGKARVHVVASDARKLPSVACFDRILADVPCSGTGTLAKNPEIKWRLAPGDLIDLQRRQTAILRSALARLAPAGRLVYSTCSLEKEENEEVVEQVVAADASLRVLDCLAVLQHLKAEGELTWPNPADLTRGSFLRTTPGVHPCEGFFAALIEKKA